LVKPSEIVAALRGEADLTLDEPVGVAYNPLMDRWSLGRDTGINYMVVARRG
jgi:2-polyprenyl-3-methyl-5-hydroxy-6-metoxy-1,4-benzoquinol methylase